MDRENRTAHKADVQRVSEEHDLDKQKRKSRTQGHMGITSQETYTSIRCKLMDR